MRGAMSDDTEAAGGRVGDEAIPIPADPGRLLPCPWPRWWAAGPPGLMGGRIWPGGCATRYRGPRSVAPPPARPAPCGKRAGAFGLLAGIGTGAWVVGTGWAGPLQPPSPRGCGTSFPPCGPSTGGPDDPCPGPARSRPAAAAGSPNRRAGPVHQHRPAALTGTADADPRSAEAADP